MRASIQWVKKRKTWFLWISICLLLIISLALLIGGYALHWVWTGFNKTLWDWLQLSIFPAALTVAGFLFTRSERRSSQLAEQQQAEAERQATEQRTRWEQQMVEQRATTEQFLARWRLETEMKQREEYQREAHLQAYFDRMENALMSKGRLMISNI